MAFEDRCSPQSAPSPPGIPHSPQNTSSATAMICNSTGSASSSPLSQEMSLCISNGQYSPGTTVVQVKQENCSPTSSPTTNQPINFSITNILSENFGKVNKKNCEKKTLLFRPYDDIKSNHHVKCTINTNAKQQLRQFDQFVQTHKLSQFRIGSGTPSPTSAAATAIDFSRGGSGGGNPLLVETTKNNLFASFNVSSYPKIHEEILNSRKYHHGQSPLSDSAFSKIPPLGNLCKTVSQIGQPASISPALKHDIGPVSPVSSVQHNQNQLSSTGRDSGLDSSDDAKSETGSTKDDSGMGEQRMWPAWVYCTRYSDRPSSGMYNLIYYSLCKI